MQKKYVVRLSQEERGTCDEVIRKLKPVFYSLISKALSFQRVMATQLPCGTMRHAVADFEFLT